MTPPFDMAAYKAELVEKGFRIDEKHELGTDGWKTIAGQMSEQDMYLHNVAISLRHAIEAAGGRGTPGGDAVSGLFHTISAQALSTYIWLKHVDEVGLPKTEAEQAPAKVVASFRPAARSYVATPRKAPVSRILEASHLPECPRCGAEYGNPCHTPGGSNTAPHSARPAAAV